MNKQDKICHSKGSDNCLLWSILFNNEYSDVSDKLFVIRCKVCGAYFIAIEQMNTKDVCDLLLDARKIYGQK